MRFLIQRTKEASVCVDGKTIGSITNGFLVFIGIASEDTKETADKMIQKLTALRIFEDENGKTNKSLADVGGALLLVSQFTLYADCKKGNRPAFVKAGEPVMAETMYEYIIEECRKRVKIVETGSFGADMKVSLLNDGPFTILLDSKEICQRG